MRTVKLLLIAEFEVKDGEDPQWKLDAFREAVLPYDNFGISLYRATPGDLKGAVLNDGITGARRIS